MAEEYWKITPVRVVYKCEKRECKKERVDSDLFYTGKSLPIYPMLYEHICPNCKTSYNLNEIYPYIKYLDE